MNILVLNCGSSSIKYTVYDENLSRLLSGRIEKIGSQDAIVVAKKEDKEDKFIVSIADHKAALEIVFNKIIDKETKDNIVCVGHRVVHGGEKLTHSMIVDEEVKNEIKKCFDLAPLHNPHHLRGIIETENILKKAINVTVFDTAFYQTIPQHAYIYGLPYQFYKKYSIRKYGFHGISHQYVTEKASEMLGIAQEKIKLISCHLGNGSSITATRNGKAVDTSMGFTPLAGLVMGTRCGDIDPSIIPWLMAMEGLSINDMMTIMNNRSGLYGISGISNDFRTVLEEVDNNERAALAIEIFCYTIKKFIGNYMAVLNKPDAVVFTAGIGENAPLVRKKSCSNLDNLGITIDEELNNKVRSGVISGPESPVKVMVIPTDEELMIAKQCKKILEDS